MRQNEREKGEGERHTGKNERQKEKRERETNRERETETHRERDRDRETETDTERDRDTQRAIAIEKESEGGRESEKKHVRHTLCYKMHKTLHGMKHHTQSQSTFTFYLIKPYQPFNQTRTSTTHNQTTFSLCLSISIVIFHTTHIATGRSSLVVY